MVYNNLDSIYTALKKGEPLHKEVSYSHPSKTNNKVIKTTLGRVWFNLLLPDDYPFINIPITKKVLNNLVSEITDKYDVKIASEVISRIQREAFKLITLYPISFDEDYLEVPEKIKKLRDEIIKNKDKLSKDEIMKKIDQLKAELKKWLDSENVGFYDIVKGKVKGSIDDLANLMLIKGYTVNIHGEIEDEPILKGLIDGLDPEEIRKWSNEARYTLYYRSTATAEPGYLARKLAFAVGHIVLSDIEDCGSKKYLTIKTSQVPKERLIGRYYLDDSGKLKEITLTNLNKIPDTLRIRSPLFCKAEDGICKKCYGTLYKRVKSKYIGMIATSAFNILGVNLMMKMRHKASQISLKKINFIDDLDKFGISKNNNLIIVEPNEIRAKIDCYVELDLADYNEKTLEDVGSYFILPGILTIYDANNPNNKLPLTIHYNVRLMKTENIVHDSSKIIKIYYKPNDTIIQQDIVDTSPKFDNLLMLLEGKASFIKSPEVLLFAVYDAISKAGDVDLVHVEVIVQNMYRCKDNPFKPCRLTNYKDCIVIGQKQLPFYSSLDAAIAFERPEKVVELAILDKAKTISHPLVNILEEG